MADTVAPVTRPVPAPHSAREPARAARTPGSLVLRGVAMVYVGLLVLLPVAVILYRTFQPGLNVFFAALDSPEALHAFQMTGIVALSAVVINTVFGVAVAVLLARYRFWGRRLLSAFVDLPVSVSPIVVGLALVLVFGPTGWLGPFVEHHGVTMIGAKPGMIVATVFVSLPLVVRALVPVLEQSGMEQEQAAASLGASAVTRLRRITLPTIRAALTYGVVLSLARCIGEYGAVLVVSNNIEGQTETAPLRVGNLVENELNYNAAYAITFVLIIVAFAAILLSAWIRRRRRS
ncbi:sulfate ABC transporter permease subunit [Rugosimonospora africana]|uniref:Sulfate ABC transporter permease subunit CysW n=1 Tax=Rugosimonospora africana TaxID=556532 RepID=A0A8J3QY71_9ACTN|nr:sulfate ABC transporter permease subunit [Rugosimonospora africana]GIH17960.1 sulfate ABC transporter permease subunit CysW [Rugosimonospora africana]